MHCPRTNDNHVLFLSVVSYIWYCKLHPTVCIRVLFHRLSICLFCNLIAWWVGDGVVGRINASPSYHRSRKRMTFGARGQENKPH